MGNSNWWLATLLAPATYFVVVGTRFDGFIGQPALVFARDPSTFVRLLAEVGGASAARDGVLVDLGFMALLVGALGLCLDKAGGRWTLVLPALALDLLEGLILWVVAGASAPSSTALVVLFGIAVAKLLAYAAGIALVIRAIFKH
ncbi:hypothetical protein [Nocardioides gilvus]|uniref:hypothetical protein n=1 Tax=Nocardioides gilvus TaxID=1735589 RepID=UPI000D743157|nr:hypothetical protein [Nocardioides gilvus]